MEQIIKGVQELSLHELIMANMKFPLFASDHEAYGVICEEVEETSSELQKMKDSLEIFKRCVFGDMALTDKEVAIRKLRASAVLCAAESIQVIAMCDKQIMSAKENR